MRIAQIAPLWIPIPPYTYGGIELVVSLLTEELVKRGNEVTLFATGDSKTSARLAPIWPKSLWRAKLHAPSAIYSLLYKKIYEMRDEFDIIHDHCEFYTPFVNSLMKVPVVSTVHHPVYEEMTILFKKFPKINYVAISKDQRKKAPGVNFTETIYHGLPLEKYEFNNKPENYLLWLSKITPEKGVLEAIKVAEAAGEKLILSGIIPKEQQDFFEYRILPHIDGKQIQFVGASDFKKKIQLFKNAKAFLYPIKRDEPFGLVVIESMACGTPVIAYNEGAMSELIKDGKTGFLVSERNEMIEALGKIGQIERSLCRAEVEKTFCLEKMVNGYENLYHKLVEDYKNKEQ